ncbi:MAG: BTAD domain-containing putative transcriptional regulator [Saprospiraceae bacterium]|nr:BTAD domain-containing putative transcriptional regulator [Saprospiraceae bacterium]
MILQKILWFGPPATDLHGFEQESDIYVEHLPLHFPLDYLEFLGQYAAAIIQHCKGQKDSFRLLRHLRSSNPHIPLVILADNPTKAEILEAFRTGATDCVEQPVDLEGLFTLVKRYAKEKVTPKVNKIQAILQELGRKIVTAISDAQSSHFVPQQLFLAKPDEEKGIEGISAYFFGNFDIFINGKSDTEKLSKREKALLTYLVFNSGRPIHRDRLIERFWADSFADSAKNSLHVAITGIRRYLESIYPNYDYIVYQNQMYRFAPEVTITSDVSLFLKHFQEALSFEQAQNTEGALYAYYKAFGMYRDEFLADLGDEDWVRDQRDRLREKYIVVLKTLGEYFVSYKECDFAINLFDKILEVDDCYELAHRYLIQCYHNKGMQDKAIRQYQKCEAILQKKLHAKPSAETSRLYQAICN